ncbi:MAG TPA: hypothetical protein VFV54_03935 [Thermoanaerobaculia bacterium]|nr:hypothetical protein [Thermoanaerobaculia bacterium]
MSPTTQFHPYQAPDATPVSEREDGAIGSAMKRAGVNPARVQSSIERARTWGRRHPGRLLGGLAIAVIGAGLMRGRLHRPHRMPTEA